LTTDEDDILNQPLPFYDRQGNKISIEEWRRLRTDEYRRIGSTRVGKLWVSTVWLGTDHGWDFGNAPVIFETMIFGSWSGDELYIDRYVTEDQARAGHEMAVEYAQKFKHGMIKHARDNKRRRMKDYVKLLNNPDRDEMDYFLLQMFKLNGSLERREEWQAP
jgi:hypothetical protein